MHSTELYPTPTILLFGLMVSFFPGVPCFSQSTGPGNESAAIYGTVLDGNRRPLPSATIFAIPEMGGPAKERRTISDSAGKFSLTSLAEGTFYLQAFKPSDGYPYNFFSFYLMPGEVVPNKVTLNSGEKKTDVVIQLGERAAYLMFKVTDEGGNVLRDGFNVTFSRPDQPGAETGPSIDPHSDDRLDLSKPLLVPPVPFRATVTRGGYQAWHFGGTGWETNDGLIRLTSGQQLTLNVVLMPAEPQPTAKTGSIVGVLLAPDGSPIVSAQVNAVPIDPKTEQIVDLSAETTSTGRFIIDGVPPGSYRIVAEGLRGYPPTAQQNGGSPPHFNVEAGAVTKADIQLGPSSQ
jgi:hypothetical protein